MERVKASDFHRLTRPLTLRQSYDGEVGRPDYQLRG